MTETLSIEELNTLLPLASLEVLPAEEQKIRLQYWKEHFTSKEITTGLGTYNSKLYDLYKKHDITSQGTTNSKRKGKGATNHKEGTSTEPQLSHTTEPIQTQTLPSTIPIQEVPVIPQSKPTKLLLEQIESSLSESFHIHYTGLKSKQKVIHQLKALATLLEEASHEQYHFSIQIDTTTQK
ncbi:hypothetical protein [Bacillus sp. CDB3]|uniref:hypothetical protein n=1 Tax=Bacillus sp. CDB3 TaxID=360310 RepID=UPI0009D82578|nr:hypothetical protein [Bacillus sp. CDB3]OQR54887.1 hypothetical protein CDB3_21650 [Bacillus sp. CDB3]